MKKRSQTKKWAEVRKVLARGDAEMLLDLVKELYDASPANQDFLHNRLKVNQDDTSALKPYLDRITSQFKMTRGNVKLDLAEARRAIREYRKATKNVPGAIELMLTYVECGTDFALEYGDIDALGIRWRNTAEARDLWPQEPAAFLGAAADGPLVPAAGAERSRMPSEIP